MPIDFGDALDAQGKIIREDKGEIDFGDPVEQSGQMRPIELSYEGQIKGLDVDEYSKYIKGGIYSKTGLDKTRAINQSTGEQALRAIGTGVVGGGLMFLENAGYIADVADWGTASDDMDNWLSEYVRGLKTDLNTKFPIYKENPNEVFDFSDPASYFEALKGTVESVVGFGLTGAVAGGLVGKGAFELFKIIKGTAKGAEMISRLGTTALMNYAESSMMAIELRENIIKEATENGISYDKALAKANEKAKEFLWANKVTAITDYITLGSIFKSNYYTRGAEKEFKNFKLKDTFQYGLKESVNEYGEEVSAGAIQQEKEFQASKELGLKPFDESTMAGRAFDYITSPEGILEGVMGFVGGPAQAGALKGTNKLKEVVTKSKTSPSENLEDYYVENAKKEFEETVKNDAINLEKKIKAYREGDTKTVDDISRQEFDELALRHFKKKNTGNLEKAIQEVIQKTENPIDKKRAEEYLAILPEMEDRYNAISKKHSLQKPYIIEDLWKLDSRKNFVQKVIIDLNNDITSKQGQLDLKIANLGLDSNSINHVKIEELKAQKEAFTKAVEAMGENAYINKSIINFQLSQVTDNYEALKQTLQETNQNTEISEEVKNLSEFEELSNLVKQKADAFVALKTYDGLYDFYNNPKHLERQEKDIVDYQLNEINNITDIDDIYTILDNVDKYNGVLSTENYKKIVKEARFKKDQLVNEKADKELRKKLTDDRELELQKQKDELAYRKSLGQTEPIPASEKEAKKSKIKVAKDPIINNKETEIATENISKKKAKTFIKNAVSSDKVVDTEFELSEQEIEGEEDVVNTILNTSDNIDDLKVNDHEERVKSDLNVIRYRDTTLTEETATDENRISNKLNKGLTDWLNDSSSKVGTTVKANVDLADEQFGGKVGKAAMDKFKNKIPIEQWSKKEIANLPIRLNVLNADDSLKSINNNKVQGWIGTVDEDNKADYDKRYKIVKALLNRGEVTSTINEITQGKFERRTDEENKDFLEGGKEFQNIYDILITNGIKPKVLIANIEGELTDANRKADTSFTGFYTPGYAFLSLPIQREIGKKKMKFPLRLNTRRVSQEEAELLLNLVKDILIDGKKFKSELNHKNAKDLTRFQAIKLLGFQGLKAMESSEHGFYIKVPGDKIAKDVKIGLSLKYEGITKNYSITELKKGTFDEEILEIFKTIPSPIERSHINKSFDAIGFTKDFEWFGQKIPRLSGYTEFIFNTKKVYSNLKMYSKGQMFLNPQLRIDEFTIKDKAANTNNAKSNSGTKVEQTIKDKAVKSKASLFIAKAKSADKVEENEKTKSVTKEDNDKTIEAEKTYIEKESEDTDKKVDKKEEIDPDIELGIFGDSESTLWSEYNGTEKDKINIEEALSFIEKNLPYVKTKVINSLLQMPNGGIAQGSYYHKIITLSRRGAKGVEYHEAFHAVLDLYLDENERQTLFEEYRKNNNSKLSDTQINEKLADEFKDYMLSNRELNIPSWLKPLYNALLDLINYFRSDKHKIFANIRAGRFNYAPINKADATKFYSTTLNPKDTKDIVDYISYLVVNNLGILKTDFKRESLQNSNVENIYENIRKAINNKKIDLKAKFDESNPTVQLFENILNNWEDYVIPMSKYKLASLGLIEKENTKKDSYDLRLESEGEDIEGNDLYGVTRFELDIKDNAAGNIKIMLSFLPNQNDVSVLGTPRFHALDETFKYFASNLSGIVAGPGENLYDLFREKLSELSLEKDFVKTVISKLEAKTEDGKELTQLKSQFCAAFSNESIIYYTIQGNKENKEFNWRIFNSSASGGANRFINKWKDAFYVKFINEDGTITNKEVIEKAINDFSILFNSYNTETSKDKIIEGLIPIFNSLGFNSTKEGINDYIKSSKSTKKALTKLSYFFKFKPKKYADINLADLLHEDYTWNESNNPFMTKNITVKAIRELAKGETNQSKVRGDGKILGAEGNMYYDLSLYSYMSKQIALWKRDDSYLNKLYEDSYHKHSLFLRWMLTDDNIQNFNIGAHISNKVIDKSEAIDTGTKNVNLTAIDEVVERINTTLNGYYSPLTFADKPTKYFFTGPGYEEMKSGIKYDINTNRYSLSPRVLESFINYFNSEANRTVDRLNLKLVSETKGLEYKPLAKNELKNSIFPSLSYGTEAANKFNLYFLTEGESEQRYVLRKNLIEDPAFVKYIAQIIVNNINSRVKSIEKLGIVKEGKILGVDKEFSNYSKSDSKYDNLNELIADYWYMSFIGNIETMFLFGGDPAWYSDISKRIPEIISSGLMLQEGVVRKEFKVALVKDIETNDPNFYENNLQKLIELNTPTLGKVKAKKYAEALMRPYKKINQTDAQAYITINRFREILIGLGRWDYDKHEKAYNKLLNNEEVNTKDFPSLQALKGTHYELRNEKGTIIPTFMKYSQAVLFPQLVKGTYLETIYNHMEANNVDELVMESGFKVGAVTHEINDISNLDEEAFKGSLNTITLQNAYWKLQVDNPTKYSKKGEALAGSQAEKNILVNINIESNYGEQTGAEVITDFVNTIGALSDIGKDKLLKKLGLEADKDGNVLGNINLDKIYEDLLEKAYTDEYPSNVIQAIEDRVPLDAIFQMNEKIQSELLSTINKATVKLKMPGAAFIQMSNFGMKSLKVISPENIIFDNFISEGLVKFEDENGNPC